jgi:predicted transcriptional regulator
MIHRAPRSQSFTILNTATFNLPIPADELGVYLHLLSKPDDWSVNGVYLAKHFGMSKDKTYRILNNLCERESGGVKLVTKKSYRNERGQMATDYIVQEPSPENQDRSGPEKPEPENQDVQSIELLNHHQWRPDDVLEQQLKLLRLTYTEEELIHFQVELSENTRKRHRPGSAFITWLKSERGFKEKQRGTSEPAKSSSNGPTAKELLTDFNW